MRMKGKKLSLLLVMQVKQRRNLRWFDHWVVVKVQLDVKEQMKLICWRVKTKWWKQVLVARPLFDCGRS